MMRLSYLGLLLLFSSTVSATNDDVIQPFIAGSFSFLRVSDQHSYSRSLMTKALAEHGYQLQVNYYPGRRLMAQLNSGVIDGDMGRAFNMSQSFDNIVRVEEPLQHHCARLYQLKSRLMLEPSGDNQPIRVGVYGGAPGGTAALLARWPNARVVAYDNLKQGALMLSNERIDLLAIGTMQAPLLQQYSERPLAVVDTFALPPTYMHVHKNHKQLAVDLADSIKQLKLVYPPPTCNSGTHTNTSRNGQ